jgi:predicted heme/steroid binding protein
MFGWDHPVDTTTFFDNGVLVEMEELRGARGGVDGTPLWLSVRGRVYDVSNSASFYGPGRKYHIFTGKDATRSFCTGCLEPECLIPSIDGLSPKQIKEADRWLE